jgi:hypothetical protein
MIYGEYMLSFEGILGTRYQLKIDKEILSNESIQKFEAYVKFEYKSIVSGGGSVVD